ncbi:MAG: hypothetical protein GY722_14520 [bacterium]|nr:hypothetical protein [bacterium]
MTAAGFVVEQPHIVRFEAGVSEFERRRHEDLAREWDTMSEEQRATRCREAVEDVDSALSPDPGGGR